MVNVHGVIVIFGGFGSGLMKDIWTFDTRRQSSWDLKRATFVNELSRPGVRYGHTMTVCGARKNIIILQGGMLSGGYLAEINQVSWDGNSLLLWSSCFFSPPPSSRRALDYILSITSQDKKRRTKTRGRTLESWTRRSCCNVSVLIRHGGLLSLPKTRCRPWAKKECNSMPSLSTALLVITYRCLLLIMRILPHLQETDFSYTVV